MWNPRLQPATGTFSPSYCQREDSRITKTKFYCSELVEFLGVFTSSSNIVMLELRRSELENQVATFGDFNL